MSAFRYQAARDDGALVRGVIESTSTSDAAAVLSARGLYPVSVEESPTPDTWHLSPRISAQHLATVFQSLASLVEAGVPLEQALPVATRILIGVSATARRFGLVIGAGACIGTVAGTRLIAARRAVWHGWLLSLPVVGPIRHALATARACRTLSALLGTGTPALAALQIARDAAGDEAVGARLDAARSPVAEGGALSNALEATGAMT